MSTTPDRNHLINSVAGTLKLMEILGESGKAMALAEVAARSVRPKSTVHRMLSSLVHLGFVEQQSDSRYRLTLKLWRLGVSVFSSLDLLKAARPHLESLMQAADETVYLVVLDPSGDIVYVAKVESPRSIRVQTQVGKLNPAWCTATGRSLLAFLPEARDRVLARKLDPYTAHTQTDPEKLRAVLAQIVQRGYAVTRAEHHSEMGGIAAPIRDFSGAVVASCGIAIPVFRMDSALVRKCVPLVLGAAEAVSAGLGYRYDVHRRLQNAS